MSIQLYRNNEWGDIDRIFSGAVTTWRADDTLDSAVRTFLSADKTPIKPFTLARLEDNTQMFTAGDGVTVYSKADNAKYKHTLTLVELTKILEKLIVQSEVSTVGQSMRDSATPYYAQIQRFIFNYNNSNYITGAETGEQCFLLNADGLATFIGAKDGEEVVLSNSNVREVLDTYLSALDARITVDSVTIEESGAYTLNLGYIDLNERIPTTIDELLDEELNNDADSYAGNVWANVENAIIPNEIRQTDTFKVKYGEATASSENRIMSLAYPIEYPTDFKLNYIGDIKYKYLFEAPNDSHYVDAYFNASAVFVDAINNFVDKEYWDTLATENDPLDDARKSYLYYVRGESDVNVSQTYKKILTSTTTFNTFLAAIFTDYISAHWDDINPVTQVGATGTFDSVYDNYNYSIDNAVYDIVYQPRMDCVLSVVKDDVDELNSGLSVVDGQTDNIIDVERYGENLFGKIQRIGNDNYFIDVKVTDYANIKPLFSRITDNGNTYVIYEVNIADNIVPSGHLYQVRYSLAEGYNNLAEKIGLKREKRIYEIPLTGYKTICLSRSYLYFKGGEEYGKTSISNLAEIMQQSLASSADNSFISRTHNRRIENALVDVSAVVSPGVQLKQFLLPAVAFGAGRRLLNLTTRFYDNYSAGLSIDYNSTIFNWLGGKKVAYNPYVDVNGEAFLFDAKFGHCPNTRTTTGVRAQPTWNGNETFTTEISTVARHKKDRAESITIQRATQIITSANIITTKLLTANNIATKGTADLYLWSGGTYQKGAIKCLGTRLGKVGEYLLGLDNDIGFKPISSVSGTYAIGDYDGNLYLAVNRGGAVTIYETDKKE